MLESDKEVLLHHNPRRKSPIISCLVSLTSVLFSQFTLSLLPLFLPASSFIILLPLSALLLVIVMGIGRFCKRVAGVKASAPAFVFFSVLFIWALYIYVIRQATSSLMDIVFNIEIIMVIVGLHRIVLLDPGFVNHHSFSHDVFDQSPPREVETQEVEMKISTSVVCQESRAKEAFTRHGRVRYCRYCKSYVMGFDHHCPAFGNCIGQRNHALFLVLLIGFAISEVSYVVAASQFTAKSKTSKEFGGEAFTSRNLVIGTMMFCLIQMIWQVVFITWHVYCVCFNIKTDEWINWKKYPEFQIKVIPHAGELHSDIQFINPYDKGILRNLKEFFSAKG